MRDGESRLKERKERDVTLRYQNTSNTKTHKRKNRMRDEESRQKEREVRERDVTLRNRTTQK